jgi:hypothetical protein
MTLSGQSYKINLVDKHRECDFYKPEYKRHDGQCFAHTFADSHGSANEVSDPREYAASGDYKKEPKIGFPSHELKDDFGSISKFRNAFRRFVHKRSYSFSFADFAVAFSMLFAFAFGVFIGAFAVIRALQELSNHVNNLRLNHVTTRKKNFGIFCFTGFR